MGAHHSSEIKYMYTNIGGNSVSIPYIRLLNGQWVPLHQHSWYLQQWNAQRALQNGAYINQSVLSPAIVSNRSLYPITNQLDYYVPNQAYYGGTFFR